MTFRWTASRLTLALTGVFYGIPPGVAAVVLPGAISPFLALIALVAAVTAATRGFAVCVAVDETLVQVRNRWTTRKIPRAQILEMAQVTTWWMAVSRAATVPLWGLRIEGKTLAVPMLATLGVKGNDERLLVLAEVVGPTPR